MVIGVVSRSPRWRLAVACVLLSSCSDAIAPLRVEGLRPLTPVPIQYATWWGQVENCSGVRGNFDAVKWYFTLGALDVAGHNYDGFWWQQGNRIALTWFATLRGGTVRHEMLHALLQTGAHPPTYFVTRCGALAPCGPACGLREDERGVPASARCQRSCDLPYLAIA